MKTLLLILVVVLIITCCRCFVSKSVIRSRTASHSLAARQIILPIFEDSCDKTGITLTRYMVETVVANPHLRELESLIVSLQTACKAISNVVERASLTGVTGLEGGGGSVNIQGEEQKRLDVITNDIMKKALRFSGKVAVLASEEEARPVNIPDPAKYRDLRTTQFKQDVVMESTGQYIAVFDPLDGSSNVDAGIPTGTIFGIFEENGDMVSAYLVFVLPVFFVCNTNVLIRTTVLGL